MIRYLKKRILAFAIDYLFIVLYASLLFGVSILIRNIFDLHSVTFYPIIGQVIGFITLTLPVFLYFYFFEISKHKGTIGKKVMNIVVINSHVNNDGNILLRNIIKFLPWEFAHIGVYWMIYFTSLKMSPPIWVWIVLIASQIIVFGYFISIILSKGNSSVYDRIASTRIGITKSN